jgi:hypothetical protein
MWGSCLAVCNIKTLQILHRIAAIVVFFRDITVLCEWGKLSELGNLAVVAELRIPLTAFARSY